MYGKQNWWPADTKIEVIIGAILTQAVSWRNVTLAIDNLKKKGLLTPRRLKEVDQSLLAELIRPAGYFNAKSKKIKSFISHLDHSYDLDLEAFLAQEGQSLREELLSIHGIGEETADSILLYAANKPVFVIDAYSRRFFHRLGIIDDEKIPYSELQLLITRNLEPSTYLFNEFHALIVKHMSTKCTKLNPQCHLCKLSGLCEYEKVILIDAS